MNVERTKALETVRAALGRTRIAQSILAVVFIGFAWLFTGAVDGGSPLGGKILVVVMTALFALVAAVLLWLALWKSNPHRSPLMRALTLRPDEVLRVYQRVVEVNVHGVEAPTRDTSVMVQLADGSTVPITVKKDQAARVIDAIQRLAPRVIVGAAPGVRA